MERFKFLPKDEMNNLPKTAGVYAFKNNDDLIYIGKAVNLRDRVKNHFQQPSYRDDLFISQVNKIGYFETGSEIEALILEANLIKKHQPKYNVVWRDDKNYFYVAIVKTLRPGSGQEIPYVFITHQPNSCHSGLDPESRNTAKVRTLDSRFRGNDTVYIGPFVEGLALKKTLRYLRRAFPYYTASRHPKNKCTWCHLDLCPGPALFENPPSPEATEGLRLYSRNIKKLQLVLQGKSKTVLAALKKEMAQLAKDKKFEEAGKVRDRIYNLENVMAHTHVINGQSERVANLSNDKNANLEKGFEMMARLLALEKINRIECYDVSNIQGKNATASMVVFSAGQVDKSEYKKFKIKSIDTPNDIAMLKETLDRRLAHDDWQAPEIIMIDGGKAQLNVAINAIKEVRGTSDVPRISVISIAKGRQELFIEGKDEPIPLKELPQEVYNLIKRLDDEAHRFAITYHKKLRKKDLLK